jgi:iron(III) transport system ATP-binding protein
MGNESLVELEMDYDKSVLSATIPGVFLPKDGTPLWLSLRRDRCFVFPCENQSRVKSAYMEKNSAD